MKLAAAFVWLAAAAVAFHFFLKIRRGQAIVLRRSWSTRFVHRVAVILFVLGAGSAEAASQAPAGSPAPAPSGATAGERERQEAPEWLERAATVSPLVIHQMRLLSHAAALIDAAHPAPANFTEPGSGSRERLGSFLASLALGKHLDADIERRRSGEELAPASLDDLTAILTELESLGLCDGWVTTYLWRKSRSEATAADVAALARFYNRLETYARVADTLLRFRREVRPVRHTPWMSKAGPDRAWAQLQQAGKDPAALRAWTELRDGKLSEDQRKALVSTFLATDAGTWENEGTLRMMLRPSEAKVRLWRRGQAIELIAESPQVFRRFDLLEVGRDAGAAFAIDDLPDLHVPAGSIVTSHRLPSWLAPEHRHRIREVLNEIAEGRSFSLRWLDRRLPLVQAEVRLLLAQRPDLPGAPVLRTLLVAFDE